MAETIEPTSLELTLVGEFCPVANTALKLMLPTYLRKRYVENRRTILEADVANRIVKSAWVGAIPVLLRMDDRRVGNVAEKPR